MVYNLMISRSFLINFNSCCFSRSISEFIATVYFRECSFSN